MNVELKQVSLDEKEILRNLLENTNTSFLQWDKRDVNKLGLYGYEYLDYWTEERRWAYFIMVDGKLAGFRWSVIYLKWTTEKQIFKCQSFSYCISIAA